MCVHVTLEELASPLDIGSHTGPRRVVVPGVVTRRAEDGRRVVVALRLGALPAGIEFGPLKACLLSIPIAFVAVLGDLIASVLKRQAGVKDSGSFVPGIGGMLDLMDSLILSAPMGYFLLMFFIL